MPTIAKWMLFYNRQYVIDKIKRPLIKAIVTLAKRYPEPTKENTVFRNTRILLDIKDEFFKHYRLPVREELFEAAFRMLICEVEHDAHYAFIFDWLIQQLIDRGWKPEPRGFPMYRCWDGPLPKDNVKESNPHYYAQFREWMEKHGQEIIDLPKHKTAEIVNK